MPIGMRGNYPIHVRRPSMEWTDKVILALLKSADEGLTREERMSTLGSLSDDEIYAYGKLVEELYHDGMDIDDIAAELSSEERYAGPPIDATSSL
jgi:hypothetical protein